MSSVSKGNHSCQYFGKAAGDYSGLSLGMPHGSYRKAVSFNNRHELEFRLPCFA